MPTTAPRRHTPAILPAASTRNNTPNPTSEGSVSTHRRKSKLQDRTQTHTPMPDSDDDDSIFDNEAAFDVESSGENSASADTADDASPKTDQTETADADSEKADNRSEKNLDSFFEPGNSDQPAAPASDESLIDQSVNNSSPTEMATREEQPDDAALGPAVNAEDTAPEETVTHPNAPHDEDGNLDMFWPSGLIAASETVIDSQNPHWIRSIGPYSAAAALFVIGTFFGLLEVTGQLDSWFNGLISFVELSAPGWWTVVPILCFTIGIITVVAEYTRRRFTWYIITDMHVYKKQNVLSSSAKDPRQNDITNTDIDKPFYLRPFNVGHVTIYTASRDGPLAKLKYVHDPDAFRHQIRSEDSTDSTNAQS